MPCESWRRSPPRPPSPRSRSKPRSRASLDAQIEALITRADVTWDDIGGLDATKRELQLAFGMAMAKKPQGVRIDVANNVLLYGPPGTGKSLLAAAVSGGLHAVFFNVSALKLLSKWFGESSRLISALYGMARKRAPAVVFMDELECLFPSRDTACSGAEHQVLSTLLAELSGVATSSQAPPVFTIGATNCPWLMDSAALSRFGRRIYVPLPDAEARQSILQLHLASKGHLLEFGLERLIAATEGLSGRQLAHVASAAVEHMVAESNPELPGIVAQGGKSVKQYRIKTRALRWSDVEPVLARIKPETPPDAVRRFETW